ncbi:Polyadenylate-binding protein-interacting protein 10 [Vitis vinifera]|uniref:Polyadenylate-binding protein-interacting protein 10 n=1 Tax=Vitis vinifera TaxID=29760 RepID=A0A438CGQ0_VITVI|nr:Polyadenylate-binding protein-interacting protein 10 [Vitis vinifera]
MMMAQDMMDDDDDDDGGDDKGEHGMEKGKGNSGFLSHSSIFRLSGCGIEWKHFRLRRRWDCFFSFFFGGRVISGVLIMAVVENAGNKVGSSSGNSESADTKDFGQSQPSNHTVMQNLQQKNTNSKPILLPNDENYYSQKIPQFQQKAGSNGVAKIQMVGSFGRDREDGGDIRDLEDLLSKLNPMAEEFVPPSLANGHGWSAGAAFGYTNNFVLQANFGNANGNAGRRKRNNYNQKRRINSRTSMAQREEVIKRTVYVSDIDQQVVDCRICGDPNSVLRFAFVEFTDEEGARAALSLAGTMLGYYPVRVLPSKTAIAPVNPTFLPRSEDEREMCARTIYCTNIDKKVTQAEVKLFFESICGEVHRLRLLGDYHHSTRIAFVEFVMALQMSFRLRANQYDLQGSEILLKCVDCWSWKGLAAESAIAALNCSGAILGSLPIRVSPSKTPVRPRAPRPALH